jgi:hypothetical protein
VGTLFLRAGVALCLKDVTVATRRSEPGQLFALRRRSRSGRFAPVNGRSGKTPRHENESFGWLREGNVNVSERGSFEWTGTALQLEAQLRCTSHSPEAGKRIARALFQIDPTHEIACQKLMQACMASGNAGGARAAYKMLWERLDDEFDIEPSTATQQLVVAIKSGHALTSDAPDKTKNEVGGTSEADPVTSLAVRLALSWMTAWDMDRLRRSSVKDRHLADPVGPCAFGVRKLLRP